MKRSEIYLFIKIGYVNFKVIYQFKLNKTITDCKIEDNFK